MRLPQGTTKRFADIATNIKEVVGEKNGKIAYLITKELMKATPRLSNDLHNSWNYGPSATGHVLGKGKSEYNDRSENGKTIIPRDKQPLRILPYKAYKKVHKFFVIWNNMPYLGHVNNGVVFGRITRSSKKHLGFVNRALSNAEAHVRNV